MAGAVSQSAFCLSYSWAAQRQGWARCLGVATAAYAAVTIVLSLFFLPALASFVVVILVLVVSLFLMPEQRTRSAAPVVFPRWDIPARMVVATGFVIFLSVVAQVLVVWHAGMLVSLTL